MKKTLGIGLFLLLLYGILWLADVTDFARNAASAQNHFNLGQRIGLFGILSLAAGILIITGGIDLSIGSAVGLCGAVLIMLLKGIPFPWPLSWVMQQVGVAGPWHPAAACLAVLALGALIGAINGLLVTWCRVQAFVVTLCGLFIYRGLARWIAGDVQVGLATEFQDFKDFLNGSPSFTVGGWAISVPVPTYLCILLILALAATVSLHLSVYGRYLYAIGSNEQAARFAGISVSRYRILAFSLCSALTALFSIFFVMNTNSVQPSSTGNFYELYAIAGAVLGGCSLRGGEGTVLGILIGTAILRLLPNMNNMLGIPDALEFMVIGGALLAGAVLDEALRRGKRTGGS